MAGLLIIDDEVMLAKNLARLFERAGHTVTIAHDGQSGLVAATRLTPDLVIVDFQLPDMDGLEVIRTLRARESNICAVMISGHANVSIAVDAMKAGYIDLLTKPILLDHLKSVVDKALLDLENRRALSFYQHRHSSDASLDKMVGSSEVMQHLRARVATIARSEPQDNTAPPAVLITGETGTGKELIARACHYAGPRANKTFVDVNCAALPAALMEAELFGYEKGAFTDAKLRKAGLIEAANGGTLFLDEIGEMGLGLQAKLLRVLEGSCIRRLGALQDTPVNVRFVAATNRSLQHAVEQGRFRADLLYRLSVLTIDSPPLRNRGGDVIELSQFFAAQFAGRYGKNVPEFSEAALTEMKAYAWPGNVRELRNAIERVVLLTHPSVLEAHDLGLRTEPAQRRMSGDVPAGFIPEGESLDAVERQMLVQALLKTNWNVTQSARLLGVSRDTLRYRIDKHDIKRSPN